MTESAIQSLIQQSGVAQYVGILHCSAEIGDDLVLLRHRDLPGSSIGIRKCELCELAILLAVSSQLFRYGFHRPSRVARVGICVSVEALPRKDGRFYIGEIFDVPEVIQTKEKPTDLSAQQGRQDADAAAEATTASLIREFACRTEEPIQGTAPLPQAGEGQNATA